MKNIYIIHGWDGSPNAPALKWLKESLQAKGYQVEAPLMPNPAEPEISAWVSKIKEVAGDANQDTIFIGHSIGCQTVLRYLQTLPEGAKVGKVILLAPWMQLDMNTIKEEGEEVVEIARPWMETPIDFAKVKSVASNITAIFSDNDRYVPLTQKDFFAAALGAKIIVEHNKGHFDQSSGIIELPSVLNAVIED